MKKLIIALIFSVFSVQAFAASIYGFYANRNNRDRTLVYPLFSGYTTTTSFYSPLTGMIIFADNGEAYIDLDSEEAKDALMLAIQKSVDDVELSSEDEAIIAIYAEALQTSEAEVINQVAAEI